MAKKLEGAGLRGQVAGETSLCTVGQEEGLAYRGHKIETLAEKGTFEEVAYLLLYGKLPNTSELSNYKKTRDWLKSHDFSVRDIDYIKKIYDKEGVKFCIKSFREDELDDLREELKKIYKKEEHNLYKELLSSVSNVDVSKAINILMRC